MSWSPQGVDKASKIWRFFRQALRPLLLAAMASAAPAAWGRFQVEDADEVDREERFGTETYNDKLSYRYPRGWQRLWDAADIGLRLSAGSLDVRRFDYVEDLKLGVETEADSRGAPALVALAFEQSRREDTVEQRTDRELRLGWRVVGPWRLFLLGDGATFKEFGDVGAGVGYHDDRTREARLYYWSVDHYYDTKKAEPEDRRSQKPETFGATGRWRFGDGTELYGTVEVDHPLRWRRPSEGYDYEYARRWLSYRVETPVEGAWEGWLTGSHERKQEAKVWDADGPAPQSKRLRRAVDLVEAGGARQGAAGELEVGVQAVRRQADYAFAAAPTIAPADYQEPPGPARSARREGGVFATWLFPYVAPHHYLQVGAHLNELRLEEEGSRAATELKAQLAWEYRMTEKARVLLNTTWDLDQLQKDFPYRDAAFRPWGGGNIQIVAMF